MYVYMCLEIARHRNDIFGKLVWEILEKLETIMTGNMYFCEFDHIWNIEKLFGRRAMILYQDAKTIRNYSEK